MRVLFLAALGALSGCGPAAAPPAENPSSATPGATSGGAAAPAGTAPSSPLADGKSVAFHETFANIELGRLWNLFGGQDGNRQVKGGADGLLIRINAAEKAWDAVGLRTAKVKVDGDFDLRGRFRDFTAAGNGSAKLIVIDAASSRGEACYVERIQIDGKNLFKFGGEVEGSLENWGFTATDVANGDLRLTRQGDTLRAYARPDEKSPWAEFAPAQPAPKTMPRVLKFGLKLSAEAQKSASVRWIELTLDGKVVPD